jgi:hypothetical protein
MRHDLYGAIHKALRTRLFDLCVELDRSDFANPAEAWVALAAYRRTVSFLREHHQHEAKFVDSALVGRAPEVLAATHDQHEAAEAALAEMDEIAAAIETTPDGAIAHGSRLAGRYRRFLIEYLAHMQHEEVAMNEALWDHFSDEQLADIQRRLQSSIAPARFAEWLEILVPSMNLDERARMFAGMKLGAPPPAFAAAAAVAERVLGRAGWDAIRARGGIA